MNSTPQRACKPASAIRVLFAQRDAIGKIGGGEAATARVLGRAAAHVTWPVTEPPKAELTGTFEFARIDMTLRSVMQERLRTLRTEILSTDRADFHEALSIAQAVRGQEFDIVECPDYVTYGRFLPFAFSQYNVKYQRLVCSLHGRASRTFEIENQFSEVVSPYQLEQLKIAERQSVFGAADIRYGFSERYVSQTRSLHSLPIALTDPLTALPSLEPSALHARQRGQVWFVARQDRVKGIDLFLAALFRAGDQLWNNYAMCGPSVRFRDRVSIFEAMSYCRRRGMPFYYRGPLAYESLQRDVYQSGGLVVIPSREETFGLVALEALLNGAPVLISKHTGAADFIRKRFGKDFAGAVDFDPLDEFAAATAIRSMWEEWNEHHSTLLRALRTTDLTPRPGLLLDAYASAPQHDPHLREEAFNAWERTFRAYAAPKSRLLSSTETGTTLPAPAKTKGAALFRLADSVLNQPPEQNLFLSLDQTRRLAARSPHINRGRIYRYLARCEDASRPVVAAAYRLRAFRMASLPEDGMAILEQQLEQCGFLEEKTAFDQWRSRSAGQVRHFLEDRREQLRQLDLDPCEYTIERRQAIPPRVSVIVSIYNTTRPGLDHFLKHLSAVSMIRNRQAEVVFVDSGSTSHQIELLRTIPSFENISYALIRSVQRETIQTAWNRGLQLAHGDYVTCLGVDEGITQSSLDELCDYLDEHPEVDWVTANTVITQVDSHGQWKRDVMSYDRTPYSSFSYLNDCTYINYVGGLYRRSIHNRFGWYDGTFKGAGDTEFKCRIFPFIKTAVLPRTLGFYFDFPAPRVTNSANIEIEDLRAWYIFRTPEGIDYLMQNQETDAWEELFWSALSGRRCWSNSVDCDLSLANNLLAEIVRRESEHPLHVLARSLRTIVREMSTLQDWSGRPWLGSIAEMDLIERSRSFFRRCSKVRPDLTFPTDFRSDAFFFAHSWIWS